ncbi:MAG: DUF917 family protein [Caldilineaceae bacterium]
MFAALVDEKNQRAWSSTASAIPTSWRNSREVCIAMGCQAELAMPVLTGAQCKRSSVRNTMTLAKRLGDARRRRTPDQGADGRGHPGGDRRRGTLCALVDVQRRTTGGFARGELHAEGLGACRGDWMRGVSERKLDRLAQRPHLHRGGTGRRGGVRTGPDLHH